MVVVQMFGSGVEMLTTSMVAIDLKCVEVLSCCTPFFCTIHTYASFQPPTPVSTLRSRQFHPASRCSLEPSRCFGYMHPASLLTEFATLGRFTGRRRRDYVRMIIQRTYGRSLSSFLSVAADKSVMKMKGASSWVAGIVKSLLL